jgi:hypothetical protein
MRKWFHTFGKERIQMSTPMVSSKVSLSGVARDEKKPSAGQTYQAGKGRIVFLPETTEVRVIGPSSCLREACEVIFENELYNVFEIDLMARSTLICELFRAKSSAIAACA